MLFRRIAAANLRRLVVIVLIVGPATGARAQISVDGIDDRDFVTDRASFEIESAAGWTYSATLTSATTGEFAVPIDEAVVIDQPEYWELRVERVEDGTGVTEEELVRFIIRSGERGSSESGLPPWVSHPPIDSAAAEFEGATLDVVAPVSVPVGLPVPVIATVRDADGGRRGVNGVVDAPGMPGLRLLRGVGSVLLPAATTGGVRHWEGSVAALGASIDIVDEEATEWTEVSGSVDEAIDWGEDARVRVVEDLTVEAGVTLTIGAGSIVLIDPEFEIHVDGAVAVTGSTERPVLFTAASHDDPWGGFVARGEDARVVMTGAIITGSGADPDWFDNNSDTGSSHRHEQCALYLHDATAELTSCWIVDNTGQAGHGEDANLTMTDCLVQRCITAGQYNRGAVVLDRSALVEFPAWDAPFDDEDNDGLYLTGGAHTLTDCLLGWALDDGIDAGSGSGGSVDVTRCWFESCYHEGMAWSESREATVRDSVTIDCGQGIECGFDDPNVLVERSLSTANLVGTRFGDNYDWDYEGFLRVRDSIIVHNLRDVWGQAWDDWSFHLDQMDIQDNFLTAPNANHAQNSTWDPVADAALLEPFLPTPATEVGVGIATYSDEIPSTALTGGVPVRLSTFTMHEVRVEFSVTADGAVLASGTLVFEPGETLEHVRVDSDGVAEASTIRVVIESPVGAELTGRSEVFSFGERELIALGSAWRYLDDGTDRGSSWREPGFDDSGWAEGAARLGYGDDGEVTEIDGGPDDERYPTAYFRRHLEIADPASVASLRLRLLRDDGALVWINGEEAFRSNLPEGVVTYDTLAEDTQSGSEEDELHAADIDPGLLVPGDNVVAVEVHQVNLTSSDLSFDLELTARMRVPVPGSFLRGDPNGDGARNVSDAITILLVLFGGEESGCHDALDVNDNERAEISDAVVLLDFLFRGGARPPAPWDVCGEDAEGSDLACEAHAFCGG